MTQTQSLTSAERDYFKLMEDEKEMLDYSGFRPPKKYESRFQRKEHGRKPMRKERSHSAMIVPNSSNNSSTYHYHTYNSKTQGNQSSNNNHNNNNNYRKAKPTSSRTDKIHKTEHNNQSSSSSNNNKVKNHPIQTETMI